MANMVLFGILGLVLCLDSLAEMLNLRIKNNRLQTKVLGRISIRFSLYLMAFMWLFLDALNWMVKFPITLAFLLIIFNGAHQIHSKQQKKSWFYTLKQLLQQSALILLLLFALVLFFFIMHPLLLLGLVWVLAVALYLLFPKIAQRVLNKKFRMIPYIHHMDETHFNKASIATDIFMVDSKKISIGLNAMVLGLGSKAYLLISRRLLSSMSSSSIEGIMAHELGHVYKKHLIKRITLAMISLHLILIANIFVVQVLYDQTLNLESMTLVFILGFLLLRVSLLAIIHQMHQHEYQADDIAADLGYKKALYEALKNLKYYTDDDHYHLWYARFYRTHPPIKLRLEKLKNYV